MKNSDTDILSLIIKRKIAETSLYLDAIQRNASALMKSQKRNHKDVLRTSKKDIKANVDQTKKSLSNYTKTNILIKRVQQIVQSCTYWRTIQKFLPIIILENKELNPSKIDTASVVPMNVEIKLLGRLQKGLKKIGEDSLSHFIENEMLLLKS